MNDARDDRIPSGPDSVQSMKAERLDRLGQTIPAVLYEYRIEPDGYRNCLYASTYTETLLGISAERLVEDVSAFLDLLHPEDRVRFDADDYAATRHGRPFYGDYRIRLHTGEDKWIRVSSRCSSEVPDDGPIWSGFMIDVTATRRLEQALHDRATHDDLTGLYNRHAFQTRFQEEQARMRRNRRSGAVLLMDLDHFKQINDEHGHDAGDLVLREVAAQRLARLREVDVLARWGGEEFAVLMPETDPKDAERVAWRIVEAIAKASFRWADSDFGLTISVGIAVWNDPDERLEQLMHRADQALYRAKDLGRNRAELA